MLNVSKGNMYPFITHTWNTIKGECPHGCSYCYMKRWGKQKPVHFDEKELSTKLGKDNFIFVGSSCDMFANDVRQELILKTLEHCRKYPENEYLFQSKNPERFVEYQTSFPEKTTLCTTIETNRQYNEMGFCPSPYERSNSLSSIKFNNQFKIHVTVEPIMKFDLEVLFDLIISVNPQQVNIGADSQNSSLPEPTGEEVLKLIEKIEKYTTVIRKKNLSRLL